MTANEPFYTAFFDVAQLAFIEEEIMCRVNPWTCKDRKRGWRVRAQNPAFPALKYSGQNKASNR